jgi:hypothetical protein
MIFQEGYIKHKKCHETSTYTVDRRLEIKSNKRRLNCHNQKYQTGHGTNVVYKVTPPPMVSPHIQLINTQFNTNSFINILYFNIDFELFI